MMIHDKRHYKRAYCQIPCWFRDMDSTGRPTLTETYVSDISEGGIRFRADRFIPVRDRLYFNLNIPSQKPVMIAAKPAWITEIPSINQYEIGARFEDLSDEDRAEIRHLVRASG